jgi:hypothetical protein
MPCILPSELSSGAATMSGSEIAIAETGGNVLQYPAAKIAQSATNWNTAHQYNAGIIVRASDGNLYKSVIANIGQNPILANVTYWLPFAFLADTTLAVPSTLTTIPLALAWLSHAVIDSSVTVTIQVANGTYALTTSQLALNHPDGARIRLLGNVATPASCTLTFTALPNPPTSPYLAADSGSIYRSVGGATGLVDGFSITKAGAAPVFGHNAILASNGSTINVGANVTISGFYGGFAASNGGNILAVGSGAAAPTLTTPSVDTYGIYAENGYVQAPYVNLAGTGGGINALISGFVRANNAVFNAALEIAVLLDNATADIRAATIGNTDIFFEVVGNSTINTDSVTFGTASVYDIGLTGTLNYNGSIVTATGETFARTLVEPNTAQHVTSATESVFFSPTGIDTNVQVLELKANSGATGVSVATNGATSLPVSLALGATSAHTGLQGGSGVLDAAGVLTVAAAWVTANTIIVPAFVPAVPQSGSRLLPAITPGASFTLTSDAGAADVGIAVNWIAIVYP